MVEKIVFTNRYFHSGLILFISSSILYNLYKLLVYGGLNLVFHISVSILVLIVILLRSEYTKLILKIWSGVFLIIASLIILTGSFLQVVGSSLQNKEIQSLLIDKIIFSLITLLCGFIIFIGANSFIERKAKRNFPEDHLI